VEGSGGGHGGERGEACVAQGSDGYARAERRRCNDGQGRVDGGGIHLRIGLGARRPRLVGGEVKPCIRLVTVLRGSAAQQWTVSGDSNIH
jgi:hypothetical protein